MISTVYLVVAIVGLCIGALIEEYSYWHYWSKHRRYIVLTVTVGLWGCLGALGAIYVGIK